MKNLLLAGALACASSTLAGCTSEFGPLTQAVQWIDAPATQQAIGSLVRVGTALVCDIGAGSSLAQSIETEVQADTRVTGMIYVASRSVCSALGGSLTGQTGQNVVAVGGVAK